MTLNVCYNRSVPSPERRLQILAAFEALVARFGLDRVTMRDLARELGISVGAIYLEFENKDALVLAVEEKWLGHVAARNAEILGADADPEEKLYRILVQHAQLFSQRIRQNQADFEMLKGALQLRYIGRKVRDGRKAVLHAMTESTAQVLGEGSSMGAFTVDEPERTAELFVQAFGEYFLASQVIERPHAEIVRNTEDLFQLLLRAIRTSTA
jgi:AcrR family transcriptional regulator